MRTVKEVAKRIEHEVGLSHPVSVRIAKKLNKLAMTVPWATPVGDGAPRRGRIRYARKRQEAGVSRTVALRGYRRRATRKK